MKNNFIFLLIFIFFKHNILFAENLNITAKNISIDKNSQISIFKNNVVIKDEKNNIIQSNYAEYNKKLNLITLKDSVLAEDSAGNIFKSEIASYDEKLKIFKSIGKTLITTNEGSVITTQNILLNINKKIARSNEVTTVTDLQNNEIFLQNFEYQTSKNIFKSIGKIKIIDRLNNSYEFSQVYINEKNKEIVGSDSKIYFNQQDFKENKNNKPRIFSNTVNITEDQSKFVKSTFTLCDYRDGDKCPPWELTASQMTHDKKSKTIFYDNAVIRIYNVPIFYFPKLAHPDPTVKRRSGFLNPTYSDTKNLGSSFDLPYFWAINNDKDFTFNNRIFASEHPLFLGEYRQAFKNSNLIFDFGYTEVYKNETSKKKTGDKSHFFSKFFKQFNSDNQTENNLEISLQHVSNKKYLKLYKIDSNLVDYETETLENLINFNHFNDEKDLSMSFSASNHRTLKDTYNDKYEYVIPDITINKNIFTEKFGSGGVQTNFKIQNYDSNKTKKLVINNLNWDFDKSNNYFDNKILTNIKNVNYDVKNVENYKTDTSNEFFGAIGFLSSVDFIKKNSGTTHLLRPKVLLKYSPDHMRKQSTSFNLNETDIFSLNRLNSDENFESGKSVTLGLNYEKINKFDKLNFSIGQVISEKKNNKNMPDISSLDKRFSDFVGEIKYNKNEKFKFNYNYLLDQNAIETNFNEIVASYDTNKIKFNINYLEDDRKNVEKKEYLKSEIELKNGTHGLFSLSNKRNLIKNSSEYYDLSYEYINDCLRAGIVYRREFYNDSEIEAENSLMFTVTLNTFGSINSPKLSK